MVSSGRSIRVVAKELGLHDSVLRRWVDKFRQVAGIGDVAPYHAGNADVGGPGFEIARLRQENERLRMQRDILKKSIAIFAGTRT